MQPSQPMEEEPHEVQQHVGRGGKHKRKVHAITNPSIPAKVVVPSPPSAPMPQNVTRIVDLHVDDIALTPSPFQLVFTSTPSTFVFQSQHVVVEVSNGSNIYKVFTFVKNESISNMLENGAIDNPMLIFAFKFVKNTSKLEWHYLVSYVFANFNV